MTLPSTHTPNVHPRRAMRRVRHALALSALAATVFPSAGHAADRYVVVLKGKSTSAHDVASRHDRRMGVEVDRVFRSALKGYSARLSRGQARRLASDPAVDYVAPDRPVEIAAATDAQRLPTGVDRIESDLSGVRAGNGAGTVTGAAIAVLDTGSGPHPDLNVAGGKACVGRTFDDGNGHGTHAAGSIAAKDDGVGVVGVAPGAPIYSVRVLDNSGGGSTTALLCGIDWVTANARSLGIEVASLSLSLTGTDDGDCGRTNQDPVHKAVCASVAQGVTYVAAAGNDGRDLVHDVPAAYDEVLAVTAVSDTNGRPGGGGLMPRVCSTDSDDSSADFSNFAAAGSPDAAHTIAAPGKCVESTWRHGTYRLESGTSMATPHVAGGAALCIASGACAGLRPAGVMQRLLADAAAQPASFGFDGDPRKPIAGRHYGNMLYVGGYGSTGDDQPGPGAGSKPGPSPTSPGNGKKRGTKHQTG